MDDDPRQEEERPVPCTYASYKDTEAFWAHVELKGVVCGNCCWWEALDSPAYPEQQQMKQFKRLRLPLVENLTWDGACHRYPPSVVDDDGGDDCARHHYTKWNDWCGEFERQE